MKYQKRHYVWGAVDFGFLHAVMMKDLNVVESQPNKYIIFVLPLCYNNTGKMYSRNVAYKIINSPL